LAKKTSFSAIYLFLLAEKLSGHKRPWWGGDFRNNHHFKIMQNREIRAHKRMKKLALNDVKLPRVYPEVNLSIAKVEVMTQEPALHSSLTLTVL